MIDYSDEVGWPAEPTRVYVDPSRIAPRLRHARFALSTLGVALPDTDAPLWFRALKARGSLR